MNATFRLMITLPELLINLQIPCNKMEHPKAKLKSIIDFTTKQVTNMTPEAVIPYRSSTAAFPLSRFQS
jgi:hypothetical protein